MAEKLTFFRSFYEAFEDFPDEQRLALYDAVMRYAFEGVEPSLSGIAATVWKLVKPNVEKSLKRSETNSQNAAKTTAETTAETTAGANVEASAKEERKANPSRIRIRSRSRSRSKEKEGKEDFSSEKNPPSPASGGAAAANAAPPSASTCPACGGSLWRDTQTGRLHCSSCMSTFGRDEVP